MIAAALAFTLGCLLLQRQAELPGVGAGVLMFVAGLGVAIASVCCSPRGSGDASARSRRLLAHVARTLIVASGIFAAGFGWASFRGEFALADALAPQWEGRDVRVTGVVASLPQAFERGVRFEFDVESVQPADAMVPSHVALAWYTGTNPEELADDDIDTQPVRAGERWRFTVRLRLPHGSANPHGFDYEAWLLERGIRATGYVRPSGRGRAAAERVDSLVPRFGYLLERLREQLRARFHKALPDGDYAGMLIALAIGDQRAIAPEEWQVFARTGVSHLMSISGLHVTMVSGLFGWLVLTLWRRIPALALRLPAQKAAAIAAMLGALAYCLISGYAVPAQRTLYMVTVAALALLLDRTASSARVLALALVVVLALDPWAVLSPGFWLSFGAVAVIFHVSTRSLHADAGESGLLQRVVAATKNWGIVQWAVTVGLAPALVVLFGQVSIVSPLANAVAIPLVSLVITPLALAGAVVPLDAPILLADWLVGLLMPLLRWLSAFEGAVWQQHAPQPWTIPLALAGVAWLLAPRGFPARALGLVLMLPVFALAPPRPLKDEAWLTMLDVGQGLAVVVRTQNRALLYDAGPKWGAQADSGSRVVLPYLRGEGIASLDMVALSHNDNDHSGGAQSVLDAIPVSQLVSSLSDDQQPAGSVRWRLPCMAGHRWTWDGVVFEWLHPGVAELDGSMRKANDRSCVLKVSSPHGSVLLTGDIEMAAEQLLRARYPDLRADALVVPHHGSGTSSTPAFMDSVSAQYALFSVGYRNRFGHPRADVWERHASSLRLRTDIGGAVSMRFTQNGTVVSLAREQDRRYWHGR